MKKLTILTAILITTMSFAQVPTYVPTNGLVGWWPFNGNANDESGNGNNGTVNGAILTNDRFGNNAQAYVFDGIDDRVEVAHNQNLNCSSVSISVWFNTNNFLASNGFGPHLLSKRETTGWGNSFQMNVGTDQTQNACWADWSISGNGGIYYINSTTLNTGNWFNLIYTHDGTNVKLFLNGALVQTIVSPGLLTFNTLPLWFGARPNAGNNSSWFNGKLDDIGIWNRTLTACEIIDLYNSQLGSSNTTSSQTQTALDSYTWPVNNQTYTQSGTYADTLVNAAGCDSIVTLNLTLSFTGINELNTTNLTISPNPTAGDFTIAGLELYNNINSMRVSDVNGKLVKELDPTASKFTLGTAKPGVYFLTVTTGNKQEIIKIIKD